MDLPCCDTINTFLSEVPLSSGTAFVFDLDDTLYHERDFVRSGFREISRRFPAKDSEAVFEQLELQFEIGDIDPLGTVLARTSSSLDKQSLIQIYREHSPEIKLAPEVQKLLSQLKAAGNKIGLLTDGRSITQRNKIEALGLYQWVSEIVISEEFGSGKPDVRNFQHFQKVFESPHFAYIGDNLTKDFVAPNSLGWTTIAVLDQGLNIHPQQFANIDPGYCPKFIVEKLS